MAVTSYSTLKVAISNWLEGEIGSTDTVIDDFIDLVEARLAGELKIRAQETALSVTISSGVAALPSDYKELQYAYLSTSPSQPLTIQTPEFILEKYPLRSSSGRPVYCAVLGTDLIFGAFPDSDYTVQGSYYAKLTALSTSNETNWYTTHAPDLLLFGALVEAGPYIGDDARVQLWEARYQVAKQRVEEDERRSRFGHGQNLRAVPS